MRVSHYLDQLSMLRGCALRLDRKGAKAQRSEKNFAAFAPFARNLFAALQRRETERAVKLAVEFVVLAESDVHDSRQLLDVIYVYDCVDVI